MRCLLQILCLVALTKASKEFAPLKDIPNEEKDILFELVKRLENSDELDKLGWKETAQCSVAPNRSAIIKKKESLQNGAQFLTLYRDVENNEACSDLCCKNGTCDMAVYENKKDHYCYLFRCEGKCKFGHHSSYISNNVARSPRRVPPSVDGSEQDLKDLGHGSIADSDSDDSLSPLTTTTATPTSMYIRAHSVGLEGPLCERDIHCEDPAAVCNYHKCLCREGYYRKGHICRKVCPASNFECLELGTLGRGPQCVSEGEVCDGITQCADGSDEFNCPDSDGPYKTPGASSKDEKLTNQGDNGRQKPNAASKETGKVVLPSNPKASAEEKSSEADSKAATQDKNGQEVPPQSQTAQGSKGQEETDNTDSEDLSKPEENSKMGSAEKPDSASEEETDSADNSDTAESNEDLDSSIDSNDLVKSQNAFISREKVNLKTETASMQGPIIALSLGLAFTVILLIFVACRLRTVRRRLRKGRPLHSNEADYLINGMYL